MDRFQNVEVGLNYGTYDTSNLDVIYVENLGEHNSNRIIFLTVEEAEWLSKKLMEYVGEFKKHPRYKLNEIITKIIENKYDNSEEIIKDLELLKRMLF